jgi:hypothetical protein
MHLKNIPKKILTVSKINKLKRERLEEYLECERDVKRQKEAKRNPKAHKTLLTSYQKERFGGVGRK